MIDFILFYLRILHTLIVDFINSYDYIVENLSKIFKIHMILLFRVLENVPANFFIYMEFCIKFQQNFRVCR